MASADTQVVVPPDIRIIPTADLFVPDWNPRKVIIPWDLANLVAFMKAGGKPPRITVWKGPRAEATSQGPGLRDAGSIGEPAKWAIIEGQMRLLAAQQVGWTHMEAEVVDCTLAEAKKRAFTSNNQNKPFWLDTVLAIEALYKDRKANGGTQEGLGDELGVSQARISYALTISEALNPALRELIYNSVIKSEGDWQVKERPVLLLTAIKDPKSFNKALNVLIDRHLTMGMVAKLVKWVQDGNDPDGFGKAPAKADSNAPQVDPTPSVPPPQAPAEASTQNPKGEPVSLKQAGAEAFQEVKTHVAHTRSQVKSGSKPTPSQSLQLIGHVALAIGKFLLKALVWAWDKFWKAVKSSAHAVWGLLKRVIGKTGETLLQLGLLVLLGWMAYSYFTHHNFGLGWLKDHLFPNKPQKVEQANNPPPIPVVEKPAAKGPAPQRPTTHKPTLQTNLPPQSYLPSHAWQASDETIETLEAEIASIPRPSTIKDYPVTPDGAINPDMAGRRTGDIQNPDKYSMKVGKDTQKILTLMPNMSSLVLTYQGDNPLGGLLGGPNKMEFYWEEVRAIHTCQVDVIANPPHTLYQCSLLVSGLKVPFTLQCATKEDLAHLVSALEFWIRNAQGGKNAPVGGLPYLHQGVLLGEGDRVDGEWEESPVMSSGLISGDRLWGVDQITRTQSGTKELEDQLQNLNSGSHILFAINPSEWDKLAGSWNKRGVKPYNPKLEKLQLLVQ